MMWLMIARIRPEGRGGLGRSKCGISRCSFSGFRIYPRSELLEMDGRRLGGEGGGGEGRRSRCDLPRGMCVYVASCV